MVDCSPSTSIANQLIKLSALQVDDREPAARMNQVNLVVVPTLFRVLLSKQRVSNSRQTLILPKLRCRRREPQARDAEWDEASPPGAFYRRAVTVNYQIFDSRMTAHTAMLSSLYL